ncbi:GerMN domain-containing protein [Desulfosporosinus sp. Sb-LF]|uniref:GerMN domain-containing protein n=1 Tax=Desulfosporosinus sp. Sb-LF TaxID=2560027 RepID=UPI001FB0E689|nr:GerMN domain-containing protein [Desulfosporosinus sp. Sb-LF]
MSVVKVRMRNSLLMGVVFLSLMFLVGCGTLETLVNKEGTSTSLGDFIGGDKTTTLPAATTASTTTTSADPKAIVLYFADSTGKALLKEERILPKTVSLARETVNQWIKGPTTKGTMQSSVPTSTMLLDIAIKENVAIVDLSKEFLKPNSKVTPEIALYGLVNTLTQFSTIKQVQIRVEGKPVTKYGTVDATHLVNKASLIKGAAADNPILPGITSSGNNASGKSNTGSGATGTGLTAPGKTSNGALPNSSPSSLNLFDYPPSST